MLLKKISVSVVLTVAMGLSGTANAALIRTALSIVIDGSGSISSGEFSTQRTAYANVLNTLVPEDGSVVLNVVQFSTAGATRIEQTALRIVDSAAKATLIGSINAMTQINGTTAIGEGIEAGYTDMDNFLASLAPAEFAPDFRKLMDVSTDGGENQGTDPAGKTANAVTNLGYTAVNCLGIGSNPASLCSWNDGFGADFAANSFAEVETALLTKIRTEIGEVPAPASVWLIGLGLLGLRRAVRGA
jgi:hypothetical protein